MRMAILPSICVVGAIVIMAMGQSGWGWLLLVAVLLS